MSDATPSDMLGKWRPILGENIRPGMIVKKPDEEPRRAIMVGKFTGQCSKGRHFDNVCFDRIARMERAA